MEKEKWLEMDQKSRKLHRRSPKGFGFSNNKLRLLRWTLANVLEIYDYFF